MAVLGLHERQPLTAASAAELQRIRFAAMGTQCEIQYVAPDAQAGRTFAAEAVRWVQAFEAKYTRFRPDSLISRINAAAGHDWVAVDADAEQMFALADQVFAMTGGVIDPTMLPLLRLWNYKAEKPRVPSAEEVRAAVALIGWPMVQREPGRIFLSRSGMGLDLGGFGKEYAVDVVAGIARSRGISNVLIDFGHDVHVSGSPPDSPAWVVGVENPCKPGTAHRRLALSRGGIASSGDYLRGFSIDGRRYGHIIDPRNGYPVANGCISVTVIAGTCLEAGLLSTTAFVLGPAEGLGLLENHFGAEGSIICRNEERLTRGFYRHAID